MKHFSLAAFSAERRMAALTFFTDTHLRETKTRSLPSTRVKAIGSVRELVTRSFEDERPEFVAIYWPVAKAGTRLLAYCDAVKEIADELGIPSVYVNDAALMSAYGHPPLARKEHVRRVGWAIWPDLNYAKSKPAAVDAATAGLYVQTQRLFSLSEAHA